MAQFLKKIQLKRFTIFRNVQTSASSCLFSLFCKKTYYKRNNSLKQDLNLEQCGQMVRLLLNIWPFATMKIGPILSQICLSRFSILPNNEKSKICQRLVIFCQSGEISPNLVTLTDNDGTEPLNHHHGTALVDNTYLTLDQIPSPYFGTEVKT